MKHIDIEAEMVVPSGTGVQDLSGLQPKIDESLTTADKTVAGAINELNGAVGDINSTLDAINGEVIQGETVAKLVAILSTKTDIKRAIEAKGQEVGDIPFSQYPAKIDAITTTPSPQPVGWQPNPTWWDIEKILEEDTEDIGTGGKCIFLLTHADDSTQLEFTRWFYKIKTSDGATYTDNALHVWDKSKDKECNLGYKTRYIIGYTTAEDKDFGEASKTMFNIMCLYCIFERCNFRRISFGGYGGKGHDLLQCVKFKNAGGSIDTMSSAFSRCFALAHVELPDSWINMLNMDSAFAECFCLTSVILPESWIKMSSAIGTFRSCVLLVSAIIPDSWINMTGLLGYGYCNSLNHFVTGNREFIDVNTSIEDLRLPKDALLKLIRALKNRTGTTTLTLTIGTRHLGLLTPAEKLVATNKNWTLA